MSFLMPSYSEKGFMRLIQIIATEFGQAFAMTIANDPSLFKTELWHKATSYVLMMRLRRMHETGIFIDQLAYLAACAFQRLKDGRTISQLELNVLRTFADEYIQYRELEREDFNVIAGYQ